MVVSRELDRENGIWGRCTGYRRDCGGHKVKRALGSRVRGLSGAVGAVMGQADRG